jgi:hypothetical protein
VAADGSGDFRTIQAAIATVPRENQLEQVNPQDGRVAIRFSESVTVEGKPRLVLAGAALPAMNRAAVRIR